jgi:hypothetical protein
MKLKKVHGGKARVARETCGKDEACGQTPQEEMRLKGLGWSDSDIDHMSAKQVEIILKKKTRKRAKASAEVRAENTPEQIKAVLLRRFEDSTGLYDKLKATDTLHVGDFFKKDLPQLRTIGEQVLKKKKDLEVALYKYHQQLIKDLKRVNAEIK